LEWRSKAGTRDQQLRAEHEEPLEMFAPREYELVDFGDGRKLERFGAYLLDRPSPAAESARPERPELWPQASARFERTSGDQGTWLPGDPKAPALPERWRILHDRIVLELKPTAVGHLGVFPEQAPNWDWLSEEIAAAGRPLRLLNLFAYTGASTLTAAAAGAAVTHVDAARSTVAWARRNAELSSLATAPIRWIVEDAATFVRRELKRGNRYELVVLDPPSYGHGRKHAAWKFDEHLVPLLSDCARLLSEKPLGLLLTCHTPGFGPKKLGELVSLVLEGSNVTCGELQLRSPTGRLLQSGTMGRAVVLGNA
ncbi:MAG TPA: class I SAM-dependent methyltransferase, partial [Pirellulales bacterium]|nr:class I SAM-dependent methyltransferase [Pirellulales bacterium]